MTESEARRCSGADGDAPAEEAGVQVTENAKTIEGGAIAGTGSFRRLIRNMRKGRCQSMAIGKRKQGPTDGPQSVT